MGGPERSERAPSPTSPGEGRDGSKAAPVRGPGGRGGWREERRKVAAMETDMGKTSPVRGIEGPGEGHGFGMGSPPRPRAGVASPPQGSPQLSREEERVAAVRREEQARGRKMAHEWAEAEGAASSSPSSSPLPPSRQKYLERALAVERARAEEMAVERRRAQEWAASASGVAGEGGTQAPPARPEWDATQGREGVGGGQDKERVLELRAEQMAAERNRARAWATRDEAPSQPTSPGGGDDGEAHARGSSASTSPLLPPPHGSDSASPLRPEWSPQWGASPLDVRDSSPSRRRREAREKERAQAVRAEEMAAERRRARAWATRSPSAKGGGPMGSPPPSPAPPPPWRGAGSAPHEKEASRGTSATDEARRAMEEVDGGRKASHQAPDQKRAAPRVVWDMHGRRKVMTEADEASENAALESKLEMELFGRKMAETDSYLSSAPPAAGARAHKETGSPTQRPARKDGPRMGHLEEGVDDYNREADAFREEGSEEYQEDRDAARRAYHFADEESEMVRNELSMPFAQSGGVGGGSRQTLLYDRQMAWLEKVERKVMRGVEEVQKAEMGSCTFTPTICQTSRVLATDRVQSGTRIVRDPIKLLHTSRVDSVSDVMGEEDPFAMPMGVKSPAKKDGASARLHRRSPPASATFPDDTEGAGAEPLPEDVGDRLIQMGKREKESLRIKREHLEREMLEERMAECTFQPNLEKTKNSKATARAQEHRELKDIRDAQRREAVRRALLEAEKDECTFKPKVAARSEKIVQRKFGRIDVVERLTNKGIVGSVVKEAKDLLGPEEGRAQRERDDEQRRELLAAAVRRQKLGVSTDGEAAFQEFLQRNAQYEANRREKLEVSSEIQFLEDHPFHPLISDHARHASRAHPRGSPASHSVGIASHHTRPGGRTAVSELTFEERQALMLERKAKDLRRLQAEATPSFKPRISKRSSALAKGRDLNDLVHEMEIAHHRREVLARARAEEEIAACTFTPMIGPAPKGVAVRGKIRMDSSDPDRLDREHREKVQAKRDAMRKAAEDAADENCTFQPQRARKPPRYVTQMAEMRRVQKENIAAAPAHGSQYGYSGTPASAQRGYATPSDYY